MEKIINEKEINKASKLKNGFVKGVKGIGAAAMIALAASCTNPAGGPEQEQPPVVVDQEDQIVKQLNDREYGKVRFVESTAATQLERSQENLAACTKTLDGKIDAFLELVNQDPNAQNLFNDVNLVKLANRSYVDEAINFNNDEMGKMMSAIYRNMPDEETAKQARNYNNMITLRSYLATAGNTTNVTNVQKDIEKLNNRSITYGQSYQYDENNFNLIEQEYNGYLQQAANNAGVNVNVFKAATEVVACKDAIWGFRDKLGSAYAIANDLYALPIARVEMRTTAMVNACLNNYLPTMSMTSSNNVEMGR